MSGSAPLKITLSLIEARVLGCLIEKEMTTPDYYPLSLNALTNACNQKSNRNPLMDIDETTVQNTLDVLIKKRLVVPKSSSGSRVSKFAHRLSNPITHAMDFSAQELAVLCELLVRGPQTIGELRTHADRPRQGIIPCAGRIIFSQSIKTCIAARASMYLTPPRAGAIMSA